MVSSSSSDSRRSIRLIHSLRLSQDYLEVAQALGVQPLLVTQGHQSQSRLAATGCPIFNDLSATARYLLN